MVRGGERGLKTVDALGYFNRENEFLILEKHINMIIFDINVFVSILDQCNSII
jgi:hypothetical protein